jgi:hypothetical protein
MSMTDHVDEIDAQAVIIRGRFSKVFVSFLSHTVIRTNFLFARKGSEEGPASCFSLGRLYREKRQRGQCRDRGGK